MLFTGVKSLTERYRMLFTGVKTLTERYRMLFTGARRTSERYNPKREVSIYFADFSL